MASKVETPPSIDIRLSCIELQAHRWILHPMYSQLEILCKRGHGVNTNALIHIHHLPLVIQHQVVEVNHDFGACEFVSRAQARSSPKRDKCIWCWTWAFKARWIKLSRVRKILWGVVGAAYTPHDLQEQKNLLNCTCKVWVHPSRLVTHSHTFLQFWGMSKCVPNIPISKCGN